MTAIAGHSTPTLSRALRPSELPASSGRKDFIKMEETIKDEGEYRIVKIQVRVKPSEKKQLEVNAAEAGFSLSDWIRVRAIGSKPVLPKPKPERETLLRLLAELGKQGSNLNQIARHLNRKQDTEDVSIPLALVTHAIEAAKAVMHQLKEVLERC